MKVIILLLAVSLVVSVCFLILYIQSTKSGQFDDTFSPGQRIFYEDQSTQKNKIIRKL